jgi:hypothetical protein
MNRLLLLLIIFLLVSSCSKKQKQLDNERLILGDWVSVDSKDYMLQPPFFLIPGYTFYTNHICDNKSGYFKNNRTSFYGQGKSLAPLYLGSLSKFKIITDSLMIFNLESGKWNGSKIIQLSADSLKLEIAGRVSIYKHLLPVKYKSAQFDKIILSSSDCFGPCPITNTIINSDGTIIFKGVAFTSEKRLFTGIIPQEEYQRLQDNFCKANIDSLNTKYEAEWTDDQTITTTFVKNGKIYKTVYDYGRKAPYLFEWAYAPLMYLYQVNSLKKALYPEFMSESFVTDSKLRKGDSIMELKQSESFLLFDYLRKGKVYTGNFKPKFKLHKYLDHSLFYDIKTDGRFYTFLVKGKPVTVDIGFNFYDANAKNWQWRKADKYD